MNTPVKEDKFSVLFEKWHVPIPTMFLPKVVHNHGNYIISLGNLCSWMGTKAEELGVEILPSVAGNQILFNDDGSVGGVIT